MAGTEGNTSVHTREDALETLGFIGNKRESDNNLEPTEALIKKAYYDKAKKFHPDKNSAPEAPAKFRAVNEAYQLLSLPRNQQKMRPKPQSAWGNGKAAGPFWNNGPFWSNNFSSSSGPSKPQSAWGSGKTAGASWNWSDWDSSGSSSWEERYKKMQKERAEREAKQKQEQEERYRKMAQERAEREAAKQAREERQRKMEQERAEREAAAKQAREERHRKMEQEREAARAAYEERIVQERREREAARQAYQRKMAQEHAEREAAAKQAREAYEKRMAQERTEREAAAKQAREAYEKRMEQEQAEHAKRKAACEAYERKMAQERAEREAAAQQDREAYQRKIEEARAKREAAKACEESKRQHSKKQRENHKSELRWMVVGAVFGTAVFLSLAYFAPQLVFAKALTPMVMGLVCVGKGVFLGLYAKHRRETLAARYRATSTYATASDPDKHALELGVRAGETWKGYFVSYTHRDAWCKQDAFSAGMQCVAENDEDMLNLIRKTKVGS